MIDDDLMEQQVRHRLHANRATVKLQTEIGFDQKWNALVEHAIFNAMEEAVRTD